MARAVCIYHVLYPYTVLMYRVRTVNELISFDLMVFGPQWTYTILSITLFVYKWEHACLKLTVVDTTNKKTHLEWPRSFVEAIKSFEHTFTKSAAANVVRKKCLRFYARVSGVRRELIASVNFSDPKFGLNAVDYRCYVVVSDCRYRKSIWFILLVLLWMKNKSFNWINFIQLHL